MTSLATTGTDVPFIDSQLRGSIIAALRNGTAPTNGIEFLWVNRKSEIFALEHHLDHVAGGGGGVWFFVGRVGVGKSALQALTRGRALRKNFAVMRADLTMGRRFAGPESLDLYRNLVASLAIDDQHHDALEHLLAMVAAQVRSASAAEREREIAGLLKPSPLTDDMARVVAAYADPSVAEATRLDVLRWFRADLPQRQATKSLNVRSLSDRTWFDVLKLLARLARIAGLAGLFVAIDEISQLAELPLAPTRTRNYERLLHMINDVHQAGAPGLAILCSGTELCLDQKRGLYALEALRSRLTPHQYSADGFGDYTANLVRLTPIADTHLPLLCEKVHRVFTYGDDDRRLISDEEIAAFVQGFPRSAVSGAVSTRDLLRNLVGHLTELERVSEVANA